MLMGQSLHFELKAVENVNNVIAPKLIGMDVTDQKGIQSLFRPYGLALLMLVFMSLFGQSL